MIAAAAVVEQGVDVEDPGRVVGGDQGADPGAGTAALVGDGRVAFAAFMPDPPRSAPRPARRARRGRRLRAAVAARTTGRRARRRARAGCPRGAVARRGADPPRGEPRRGRPRQGCPTLSRLATSSPAVRRCPRAAAARSSASRSWGRTRLTTTPPTGRPPARSSAMPSPVSCTGISSSTVTRWIAVRRERRRVVTVSACDLIGPTLARPASSLLTLRNWAIRPVGGASSTIAS